MQRLFLTTTALSAILLLSACTSPPVLAPAGQLALGASSVKLDRDWTDVTKATFVYSAHGPKVHVLTIDALTLNQMMVSEGLSPSDPLTINVTTGDTKSHPSLRGKADMSLSEQTEFVAESVAQTGYNKVETDSPQPVTVDGVKGVRFGLTGVTKAGLNIKGLAQAVSKGGLNYYVVYLAPGEHYYDANLSNVTAVMDSVKLP